MKGPDLAALCMNRVLQGFETVFQLLFNLCQFADFCLGFGLLLF